MVLSHSDTYYVLHSMLRINLFPVVVYIYRTLFRVG